MDTPKKDPLKILEENAAKRASGEWRTKYKNASGQHYTLALFEGQHKVYSLAELGELYVEYEDLLEYEFAEKYLDGWSHWEKLLACQPIRVHIDKWREELDIKIRSRALRHIMEEASDPLNRSFVQANRYLIEKSYLLDGGSKKGRGRPKKIEAVNNEFDMSRINADAKRILSPKEIN